MGKGGLSRAQTEQKHWDSAYLCQGTSYQCHDMDPDCHQNLIICSMAHCQPSLKIPCISFWKFFAKLLTDRQTNKQTRTIKYPS